MYELLPFVVFFTFWNIFWARCTFYVQRDMKFLLNPAISVVGIALPIYACFALIDDLIFGMICAIVSVALPYSFWFIRFQFGWLSERPRPRRRIRRSGSTNGHRRRFVTTSSLPVVSSDRRNSSRLSDVSRDARLVIVRPGGGTGTGDDNNNNDSNGERPTRSSVSFSLSPSELLEGENGEFLIPNNYLDQVLEDDENNIENGNDDPDIIHRTQFPGGGRRSRSSRRRRSLIPKQRLEALIICKRVIDEHEHTATTTSTDEHNSETAKNETIKSSLTSNPGNNIVNIDVDDHDDKNLLKDDIEQQLPLHSDHTDQIIGNEEEEKEKREDELVVSGHNITSRKRRLSKHHPKSDIVLERNNPEDEIMDEIQYTNQSNEARKENNNNNNLFPIPVDINTTISENNETMMEINHDNKDEIHNGDDDDDDNDKAEGEVENIDETNTLLHEQLRTCTICMEPYQVGDEIAWSHNEECQHVFHKNCIVEWLTYDTNCPLCKKKFYELRVQFQIDDDNTD